MTSCVCSICNEGGYLLPRVANPYLERDWYVKSAEHLGSVLMLRFAAEGDYWESDEGFADEDLAKVLKAIVKSAKAEKRTIEFLVTVEIDADLEDNQKHVKQSATALAELALKSRKKLAPAGVNVKRVMVEFEGGSVKKAATAKKNAATAKKKAVPTKKKTKR